jgi:hypothetical protein
LWLLAVLLAVSVTAGFEATWRYLGYPAMVDDYPEWATMRASVQPDSTVLVGSSRAMVDVDQRVFTQLTGVVPLQLGIDGENGLPVLMDLLADTTFHGTIVCEFVPFDFEPVEPNGRNSASWVSRYEDSHLDLFQVSRWLDQHLVSKSSSLPWVALLTRPAEPPAYHPDAYSVALDRQLHVSVAKELRPRGEVAQRSVMAPSVPAPGSVNRAVGPFRQTVHIGRLARQHGAGLPAIPILGHVYPTHWHHGY